jgi:hypothetical protein
MNTLSSRNKELCNTGMFLYDPRQLVKLEWSTFKSLLSEGSYDVNRNLTTYQLNDRQKEALYRRLDYSPYVRNERTILPVGGMRDARNIFDEIMLLVEINH